MIDRWLTASSLRTLGFLGFGVFVLLGASTLSRETPDYWQHLDAIRTLSSSPWQPPPLYTSEPYQVHLYTPYHLMWGLVLSGLGISIWNLAVLMAVMNAALFALGARLIAKHVLKDPGLDLALLATLLVFWNRPIWWSGVYSLGQLSLTAMYPSFFAMAMTMIIGALWLEEACRSTRAWVALSIGIAVVVVTHPVTASFLLLFLLLKTVMLTRPARGELIRAGLAVGGGCMLAMLWPYYSFPSLAAEARAGADFFGDFGAFYGGLPSRLGPEVIGLAALPLVKAAHVRRFLAVLLLVTVTIYAVNYVLQLSHVFSRYLIFITFVLHLSVVAALSSTRRQRLGRVVLPLFVLLAALGGARQIRIAALTCFGLAKDVAAGAAPGTHSIERRFADLEQLDRLALNHRPVIMAPLDWAYRVSALSRLEVVGVLLEPPTMPDYAERRRDVQTFYDHRSPIEAREEIIDRRGVDFILVPGEGKAGDIVPSPDWEPVLHATEFDVYATRG